MGIRSNQLPETLQPYIKKIRKQLTQERFNDDYDILFHTNELKTYYISAKLYNEGKDFLGTIIVGPFLLEEPSYSLVEDVLFHNQLPISLKYTITQYYLSLPLISEYEGDMIAEFLAYHTENMDTLMNYRPKIRKARISFKISLKLFPLRFRIIRKLLLMLRQSKKDTLIKMN